MAASALPAAAGVAAWPALGLAAEPAVSLYKVVYDMDHPDAVAFGREAAAAGYATAAIDSDVTDLWYNDLYHRWKQGPAAIAGLTTPVAAFCLETFAQDVGMRVVFRAEHGRTAEGGLQHSITAPKAVIDRAALLDTGANWSAGLAKLISRCPADLASKSSLTLACAPAGGQAQPTSLVSWVVAPVRRA